MTKGKKVKAPACTKIYYEDKLSKKKYSFPLYDERDIAFLKHKSLQS